MNYVQLHLGDWIAATVTLTATERGVYMDLLVRYYKEERPLTENECKRIARAYAPAEHEAMHYVLQEFFTRDGDVYHHKRCEEEIVKANGVSEKRKRAAASRWGKKNSSDASAHANASASADQMHSKCNANGMLTNNQEPVTNNQEKHIYAPDGACVSEASIPDAESIPENLPNDLHSAAAETVDDFALDAEVPPVASEVKKPVREKKACCPVPKPEGLSDEDWAEYKRLRKQKRLPLTTRAWNRLEAEAQKAGKTIVEVIHICLEHSWAGYDSTWPLNSAERNSMGQSQKVFVPPSRFDEIDYSAGINPDGSF